DKTLNLSEEQKKENKKALKKAEERISEYIRRLYRIVAVPAKEGFREIDLGIPTYGEYKTLCEEIYGKLVSNGEILERIAPLVIKEKYLVNREYVFTEQLYQSLFRTPGELRPASKDVIERSITEGVKQGLFGLGELADEKPVCRFFKEVATVAFTGKEILIPENLCKLEKPKDEAEEPEVRDDRKSEDTSITPGELGTQKGREEMKEIRLKFEVPKGKVSNIMGIMNLLQSKFNALSLELRASDGSLSKQEYEDKVLEALRQLGIKIKE
ncbi:MAG: hypothetical protein N2317_06370, partial [Syntrophales bacterium]|nr:hypothetical protein [Syntrophales bacterium]